jgi:hypothetical protein
MSSRPRRNPKPNRRRALELLASCNDGCTEAIMLAHGFTIPQMAELVRAGLATASAERVRAGSKIIEVAVRITEAGRRTLEDMNFSSDIGVVPDRRRCDRFVVLRERRCPRQETITTYRNGTKRGSSSPAARRLRM